MPAQGVPPVIFTVANVVVPVNVGDAVVGNSVPVPLSVYSAAAPLPLNPAILVAVPVCPEIVHSILSSAEWSLAQTPPEPCDCLVSVT